MHSRELLFARRLLCNHSEIGCTGPVATVGLLICKSKIFESLAPGLKRVRTNSSTWRSYLVTKSAFEAFSLAVTASKCARIKWKLPQKQGENNHITPKKQDGAHEPECKHICQSTVYRKRHSRLESLFHVPARCWTSCAGDSTTKAACAGDFTTKLRLRHEGSSFCIQIKHWRKGSGRSTARKKQWHCPKISKISP